MEDTRITFVKHCPMCGGATDITVGKVDFDRWQQGELIQNVWPDATPEMREVMISGMHNACWKKMFAADTEGAS